MRWLVQVVSAILLQQTIQAKFIMQFVYFGNCKPSYDSSPYRLENTSYGMVSADQSEFNTTLVVEQDFDKIYSKLKIYECKTMNEAECELVMNIVTDDQCQKIREKGQFYSIFADHAHPPITCPWKKVVHHIVQARLPMDTLSKLPVVENWVYRLDFWFEHHGNIVGCWKIKAKKLRVKKKKN
ncbi:hypothetical protein GE061_010554 [Apolygus lucorum]|uniref:MD-2-related lipid-recognition domain-containing protein n=1 Tax=Apolygus lucorum TaxID=248454 RepID=A0A8S9XZ04_APOLU|nr:hypothetical protein GE061_010554 [Apolygus lucorum]